MQEIGESRQAWGTEVWNMAEEFCNNMKHVDRPYWIVYAAKPDRGRDNTFRQTMKAYFQKPPALLGILVWYVNNKEGTFVFVPSLSSPPDIPIDPSLLSDKAEDQSARVMERGKQVGILLA